MEVDDYTWFANNLVETQTYYIRIVTRDIFSHHSSNPHTDSFEVIFKHACTVGVLSNSVTAPTDLIYTVEADGSTAA